MEDKKDLRRRALNLLAENCPLKKARKTRELMKNWMAGELPLDCAAVLAPLAGIPGRPDRPLLVTPREVRPRGLNTLEGRATLLHALVHIEFNAINLALDAIWRFPGMPEVFYADWLRVADEEALHFTLLADHLLGLGFAYGDFPAHNGLWEMAERTKDDLLARMGLIPRTMEARGLDVTPGLRAKLVQAGDMAAAEILDVILRDEIGHVEIGNRWFSWLCAQRGIAPSVAYRGLLADYRAPQMRGPFNLDARRQAGFSEEELRELAD